MGVSRRTGASTQQVTQAQAHAEIQTYIDKINAEGCTEKSLRSMLSSGATVVPTEKEATWASSALVLCRDNLRKGQKTRRSAPCLASSSQTLALISSFEQ